MSNDEIGKRIRNSRFVLYDYTQEEIEQLLGLRYSYIIIGKQISKDGLPKLQGYVEFAKQGYMPTLERMNEQVIWKPRKDIAKDIVEKCKASGDFIELGRPSNQGERKDLNGEKCKYSKKPIRSLCEYDDCNFCFMRSFASNPKAAFWSKKNTISPRLVRISCAKRFFFDCDVCHHTFDALLNSITSSGSWCNFCIGYDLCKDHTCKFCLGKSFASQEKSKFWSSRNNISPRFVTKYSKEKYWFNCNKCEHEFESIPNNITGNDSGCPYCAGKKLCLNLDCTHCLQLSFAGQSRSKFWSKKNTISPRFAHISSGRKFWFDCGECPHSFEGCLRDITRSDVWCPYCASKILCSNDNCEVCNRKAFSSNEMSIFWSERNKISPRAVFKNSGVNFWFICLEGHEFQIKPYDISSEKRWCNLCHKKTEKKLYLHLKEKYLDIEKEKTFTWCKSPTTSTLYRYDFFIESLFILIELDGDQHFRQVLNWESPESTREKDVYKMRKALERGYTVIRLLQTDVFKDLNDWKSKLTSVLYKHDVPVIEYISSKDVYALHAGDLEKVTTIKSDTGALIDCRSMTVPDLRKLLKKRGVKGYSGLKKMDLIKLLNS